MRISPILHALAAAAAVAVLAALAGCGEPPTPPTPSQAVAIEPPAPDPAPPPATPLTGDIARGRALYESNTCWDCHATEPDAWWGGPTMFGYWGSQIELDNGAVITVDEEHFIQSLDDPYARVAKGLASDMPTYEGRFSAQDYADLIAFVRSLR